MIRAVALTVMFGLCQTRYAVPVPQAANEAWSLPEYSGQLPLRVYTVCERHAYRRICRKPR